MSTLEKTISQSENEVRGRAARIEMRVSNIAKVPTKFFFLIIIIFYFPKYFVWVLIGIYMFTLGSYFLTA